MKQTTTDGNILKQLNKFIIDNGYSPSTKELMLLVGLKSTSTMNQRLFRLRDKGLVNYIDKSPRTLVMTNKGLVKLDEHNAIMLLKGE